MIVSLRYDKERTGMQTQGAEWVKSLLERESGTLEEFQERGLVWLVLWSKESGALPLASVVMGPERPTSLPLITDFVLNL